MRTSKRKKHTHFERGQCDAVEIGGGGGAGACCEGTQPSIGEEDRGEEGDADEYHYHKPQDDGEVDEGRKEYDKGEDDEGKCTEANAKMTMNNAANHRPKQKPNHQ